MTEEYSFPPFDEEINRVLKQFNGKRMETYRGKDVTPLWEKDKSREEKYMKPLIPRREAIRNIFRERDPGSLAMINAVGKEMAHFSLETLF